MEKVKRDILSEGSEKREQLIKDYYKKPFEIGEYVTIRESLIRNHTNNKTRTIGVEIVKVNKKTLLIKDQYGYSTNEYKINKEDVIARDIRNIGENPFNNKFDSIRTVNFSLESILFNLNVLGNKHDHMGRDGYEMNGVPVADLNWNPFVYNKEGKKEYYQRDFCWSLKDKQLLIESIYAGIDCGKILIRKRGWGELEKMAKNGETELAFNDIVDGKQRLDAVRGFILGEYTDSRGNYYGDLSLQAQYKLTDNQQFSYAEMGENTSDEEVVYQFLKMNFTGVPQSQEHLDFVKEISTRI